MWDTVPRKSRDNVSFDPLLIKQQFGFPPSLILDITKEYGALEIGFLSLPTRFSCLPFYEKAISWFNWRLWRVKTTSFGQKIATYIKIYLIDLVNVNRKSWKTWKLVERLSMSSIWQTAIKEFDDHTSCKSGTYLWSENCIPT